MKTDTTGISRAKVFAALAVNLTIAVLELVAAGISWSNHGASMFQFYTEDSNLFALLACSIYSAFLIKQLLCGGGIPAWTKKLKYASVCCLSVTLIVVVAVLVPMYGMDSFSTMMFSGSMLYHHFLCPVLAILSFLLLERNSGLCRRDAAYALIPTLLYAAVVLTLNAARVMEGPYPFLMVYEQPVWVSALWIVAILGGAYLLALLLKRLNGKGIKSR